MAQRTPREWAAFLKERQARIDAERQATPARPLPVYWCPELCCWFQVQIGEHEIARCDPPT